MKKGAKRFAWGVAVLLAIGLALLLTWRAWVPAAARAVLAMRGVQIKTLAWEGKDSIKATEIEIKRSAAEVRISSLTTLRPKVWREALRNGDSNLVFVKVDGWKVIPKESASTSTNAAAPFGLRLKAFQAQLEQLQARCPRAVLLNGFVQHPSGEFRFGVVEWNEGLLSGDFTWPGLNDPADFKVTKTNLIVRQLALEIGSRLSLQQTNELMRLAGYARWQSNRVDLDLSFDDESSVPKFGEIKSRGLTLPGNLIGLPEVEQLSARFDAAITNGRVRLVVSEREVE